MKIKLLASALFLLPSLCFAVNLPAYPKAGVFLENLGTRIDITFDKLTLDPSLCVDDATLNPVTVKSNIRIGTEEYAVAMWSCLPNVDHDGYAGYIVYATDTVFGEKISVEVLSDSASLVAGGASHPILVTTRY